MTCQGMAWARLPVNQDGVAAYIYTYIYLPPLQSLLSPSPGTSAKREWGGWALARSASEGFPRAPSPPLPIPPRAPSLNRGGATGDEAVYIHTVFQHVFTVHLKPKLIYPIDVHKVNSRAVYTRENKPRIRQSAANVSRELSHLYEHGLYKKARSRLT